MLDVLILGGGFSGIAAARQIHRQGLTFEVLEANHRLGGRVFSQHYPAYQVTLDLGGQWVGPTQDRLYALLSEYHLDTYPTYNEGKHTLDIQGKLSYYTGLIPKVGLLSLLNLAFILEKLERMARKIQLQSPGKHPKSVEWDQQTLASFVQRHCRFAKAHVILQAGLETVFAAPLDSISLLHALFYIRSGTSLHTLLSISNGAQQDRVKGGMQRLVDRMAEAFIDKIQLNQPIVSIEQKKDFVQLTSATGTTWKARRLICAIPPHLLAKIVCTPAWSADRQDLLSRLPMGSVAKCFAIYERPFWRENGHSGQVVADSLSPFQTLFDASPQDGSRGIILGFCLAERYEAFFQNTPEDRKQKALHTFTRYFGPQAAQPLGYVDYSMKESDWSGGCYAAIYPPGVRTHHQNLLATAEGLIHFAGTETSDVWYGYIEGAIRAGERAANNVLSSLN
jgi:monoamine oxidase